ncbi:MAG: hypothetical protein PHE54_01640 [Bacilli bacterium]|nr:hypothetical protein [Bacilli bacterium]
MLLLCSKCVSEYKNKKSGKVFYKVQVKDDGLYDFICDNGHNVKVMLHNKKYEILFDSGILAYFDGYYREAISSIATSFERFLEYCILIFIINLNNNYKYFYETWKYVSNSSERQLGAFYFLYLSCIKKSPPKFEKIEFRNKVIHKGYIPTKIETYDYIKYIYEVINKISKEILTNIDNQVIDKVIMISVAKQFIGVKKNEYYDGLLNNCFLSDIFVENPNESFEEKLKIFEGTLNK